VVKRALPGVAVADLRFVEELGDFAAAAEGAVFGQDAFDEGGDARVVDRIVFVAQETKRSRRSVSGMARERGTRVVCALGAVGVKKAVNTTPDSAARMDGLVKRGPGIADTGPPGSDCEGSRLAP